MLALDQAQAAAYVVSLTCALAMQPYKAQVLRWMLYPWSVGLHLPIATVLNVLKS